MIERLHKYRFELFFISLVCILFGSMFFPKEFFANQISPLLFLVNILSGILFFIRTKKQVLFVVGLFIIVLGIFLFMAMEKTEDYSIQYIRLIAYFTFYCLVTYQLIRQVWNAKTVTRSVIFGLMSGYICLGLLGFFTCFCIELVAPGSFNGIAPDLPIALKVEELIYFSFITLLTIGYGEITPITDVTQKTAVLIGIVGQFYLVIVTAVVIEKYIRHTEKD